MRRTGEEGNREGANRETRALVELKTRARLRLNALKAAQPDLRLRDCLNAVSKEAGFTDYAHARRVLNGEARPGEDFGTFWYAPACAGLLNQWFASYEEARAALQATPRRPKERRLFLLPYKRQFMVVEDDFIRELGMDPEDEVWAAADRDAAQVSTDWPELAFRRLRAARA